MQATLGGLRKRREDEGEGGFTLIELLIVIVILAVLAAIVVFAVQNLTGQSAKAACEMNYKIGESALETYKAQEGSYPATLGALLVTGAGGDGPWLKQALPTGSAGSAYYHFKYLPGTSDASYKLVASGINTTTATGVASCAAA